MCRVTHTTDQSLVTEINYIWVRENKLDHRRYERYGRKDALGYRLMIIRKSRQLKKITCLVMCITKLKDAGWKMFTRITCKNVWFRLPLFTNLCTHHVTFCACVQPHRVTGLARLVAVINSTHTGRDVAGDQRMVAINDCCQLLMWLLPMLMRHGWRYISGRDWTDAVKWPDWRTTNDGVRTLIAAQLL
jgi:hypothetical protein